MSRFEMLALGALALILQWLVWGGDKDQLRTQILLFIPLLDREFNDERTLPSK